MKKIISSIALILAMFVMLFSLTACGKTTYTFESAQVSSSTLGDQNTEDYSRVFVAYLNRTYSDSTLTVDGNNFTLIVGGVKYEGKLDKQGGGKQYFDSKVNGALFAEFDKEIEVDSLKVYLQEKDGKMNMVLFFMVGSYSINFIVKYKK